jgi:hypothetical protein
MRQADARYRVMALLCVQVQLANVCQVRPAGDADKRAVGVSVAARFHMAANVIVKRWYPVPGDCGRDARRYVRG